MATIRKMWVCKNTDCKNEKGRHRGYKKVHLGEKLVACKHCGVPMALNDSYTTRMQVAGESRTRTISANKQDAEDYIAECRTALRKGDLLPGEEPAISWKEAKKRFEAWMDDPGANEGLSESTAKFYRSRLKALEIPFKDKALGEIDFTGMALQDIQKKHVDAFKSWRMKSRAASTVNGSIATIKRMYSVICDQERAALTPRLHEAMTDVHKVSLLECNNEEDIILETQEEIDVFLEACKLEGPCGVAKDNQYLHHFAFGILNTGLRHADMLKLRIEEVDFQRNEIRTTVKGSTKVTIPITGPYRVYLEEWLNREGVRRIKGVLIPAVRARRGGGKPKDSDQTLGYLSRGFTAACERAAEKYEEKAQEAKTRKEKHELLAIAEKFRQLTPHHLRHTFATHFLYKASKELGATAAVHVLSKILGHSSTYITERYSHVLNEINQAAMASFGAQMFSAAESR